MSTSIEKRQGEQVKQDGGISDKSTGAAATTVFPLFIQIKKRSKVQRSKAQPVRKMHDGI
ncbi:MAG: hypothetical protein ACYDCM_02975 [Candidatus Acidiferrales bacterium]